jgi:hypothetical protein
MRFQTIILATLMPAVWLCGCRPDQGISYGIIFDSSGLERPRPTAELLREVLESTPKERDILLSECAQVLDGSGCYSRLVAASALLDYFEDRKDHDDVPSWVYGAIVNGVIEVVEGIDSDIGIHSVEVGPVPSGLTCPVRIRCVVTCDGRRIVLREGLPKGWSAGPAEVICDGSSVEPVEGYASRDGAVQPFDIARELVRHGALGGHNITVRIKILSPDGNAHELTRYMSVNVQPESAFRRAH